MTHKLAIEFTEVLPQTIEQNGLDLLALIEQDRGGMLDRSVHREKSVGDDFEAGSRLSDCFSRPAGIYPGKLHLREGGNLGNSAESKGKRVGVSHETAARRATV